MRNVSCLIGYKSKMLDKGQDLGSSNLFLDKNREIISYFDK